jgi:hypothetical protein
MSPSPDRLVRASVVLTLLGLGCFIGLLALSAHGAAPRMLNVALLTLGGFSLTGLGVLGFFLVGVRYCAKKGSAEKPDS